MVLRIGHRGAAGYEPENTLRSFQKALDLDVDMVELDIHLCRSGELVVIHDHTLKRTTNGSGYVARKTLEELKQLDAGKGEKIPTLEEVLNLINGKVQVNVELKGRNTAKPLAQLLQKYNYGSYDDYLVSSFNHAELAVFHELLPQVKTGMLYKKPPRTLTTLKRNRAYALHISKNRITRGLLDKVHNLGMKVFAYTANDPQEIEKLYSLQVDGIFSDYPDRV